MELRYFKSIWTTNSLANHCQNHSGELAETKMPLIVWIRAELSTDHTRTQCWDYVMQLKHHYSRQDANIKHTNEQKAQILRKLKMPTSKISMFQVI